MSRGVALELSPIEANALGALLAVALAIAACPRPAGAAFDLRHASPEALGAASADLAFDPLGDCASSAPGVVAAWSHASLYGVEGLAGDDVAAAWSSRRIAVEGVWSRAGTPDLAEETEALELRERGSRAVLLRARAERLALRFLGDPERSGWAGSAGVLARLADGRATVEVGLEGDRLLRSAGADRLGAAPAAVWVVRVRAPSLSVAFADRWERDGRRSPRVALLLPVGSSLALRASRGSDPGRLGFSLEARVGRVVVAAGRLDGAEGGSIASVGVRIALGPTGHSSRSPDQAPPGARCWSRAALL